MFFFTLKNNVDILLVLIVQKQIITINAIHRVCVLGMCAVNTRTARKV